MSVAVTETARRGWSRAAAAARPVAALGVALLLSGIVVMATSGERFPSSISAAWAAFSQLFDGAFGSWPGLLRSLAKATPLLFSGLGVALALRAGLFNIGAEGQLLVGGMAAAWAGFRFHGLPAAIHVPLALAAGAGAGAAWGFVPGLLKAWRGAHEVIVTIMLNYVAIQLTHYLVLGPFNAPGQSATPLIAPSAHLWAPANDVTGFSTGFFLAVVAAALVWLLVQRTALGFEIRAVGQGASAARAAGIPVGRTIVAAMTLSGALAGLAGAVEVLGVFHRFFDQFSPGYGFDSIAVALLGALHPLGVALAAVFFGGLKSGALTMYAETQTPIQIVGVVQALVILAVGVRYVRRSSARRRSLAPTPSADAPEPVAL